ALAGYTEIFERVTQRDGLTIVDNVRNATTSARSNERVEPGLCLMRYLSSETIQNRENRSGNRRMDDLLQLVVVDAAHPARGRGGNLLVGVVVRLIETSRRLDFRQCAFVAEFRSA